MGCRICPPICPVERLTGICHIAGLQIAEELVKSTLHTAFRRVPTWYCGMSKRPNQCRFGC